MSTIGNFTAPASITSPAANDDKEAVHKAALEFESLFVAEMMKPMFESQEVDPLFGGGESEKVYRSMLVDEYGKQIAKSGGIGIAEHVEKELLKLKEVPQDVTAN